MVYCTQYFLIEIGSRGIYNTLLTKCIAALGVTTGKRRNIMDTASKTAPRASYDGLCRQNKAFKQIDLISWKPSPIEGKLEDVPAQDTRYLKHAKWYSDW